MTSITRALDMMSDQPDSHGVCVKLGDLRALFARVERMEAAIQRDYCHGDEPPLFNSGARWQRNCTLRALKTPSQDGVQK